MTLPLVTAAVAGVLLIWLARSMWLAAARRKAARAGYFDALHPLFDRMATRQQPTGFPRMTGYRGALAFDIQALPDALTFRKLPSLWVMVTLPAPLPLGATLDIMTRPTGQEPFSHFPQLSHALPCPEFLPEGTGLRSDDPRGLPPEALVARHSGIFRDPRVKELILSPKGLRVVLQGDEADRGKYLLFRDAELGREPLAAARVAPLLHSLVALRDDLLALSRNAA